MLYTQRVCITSHDPFWITLFKFYKEHCDDLDDYRKSRRKMFEYHKIKAQQLLMQHPELEEILLKRWEANTFLLRNDYYAIERDISDLIISASEILTTVQSNFENFLVDLHHTVVGTEPLDLHELKQLKN